MPLLKILSQTVVLVSVLLLNACVGTPEVRVNIDKSADFSSYHTYGFVEPLGTDKAGYTTLVTNYLREAVSTELERRDYVYSSNPDLLVNFYTRLESRTFISSAPTPVYYGGYYDYRHGVYATYPRYIYRPHSYNYQEGTVNVDLVDAKKKQMVWEGVAVNEVDSQDLGNPQQAFNKVIAAIFVRYPYRAGGIEIKTEKK
ncbi:MAG: DUF4136 domain-containing protein [Gammaproteobacteria bacterium]|nr:DUF4136 domain-containing protein [Gammaproteobacteria bacterium]